MAIGGVLSDFRHGTHGALTTLTDFSAKTISVDIDRSREKVESTTFGNSNRSYEASFKDAKIKAVYKYDTTVYGQLAELWNNDETVDFQGSPTGTATGNVKISGDMFMESFKLGMDIGELLQIEVEWMATGTVTDATHS